MDNHLKLKLGLLHRIVIEFNPVKGARNTIDIRSKGTIRYSTPSIPQGEITISPFKARNIIRECVSPLFMRENDIDGPPSEDAYHWKAVFYSKNGVIRTMEGWSGESQDRFTDFEGFLSELENVTNEDFGAFAVEKMMREQAEAKRIRLAAMVWNPLNMQNCCLLDGVNWLGSVMIVICSLNGSIGKRQKKTLSLKGGEKHDQNDTFPFRGI